MSVIEKIVTKHQEYGASNPTGEWGMIQSVPRSEYMERMDSGDVAAVADLFSVMFRTSIVHGLISFDIGLLNRDPTSFRLFMGDLADNVATWSLYNRDTVGLERLRAPLVGRPITGEVRDEATGEVVPIMVDTPRHDHYASTILGFRGVYGTPHVLEIGGGYGGMALQLVRQNPSTRVTICDLPETLYLAWYFLAGAGVSVGWYNEPGDMQVRLLPAQEADEFDEWVDVVFAAHSLSEMPMDVVTGYLAMVQRLAPSYFYHDNTHKPLSLVFKDSPPDRRRVSADDFPEVHACHMVPGPPYVELYRAPTIWRETAGRYWEFVYEKR